MTKVHVRAKCYKVHLMEGYHPERLLLSGRKAFWCLQDCKAKATTSQALGPSYIVTVSRYTAYGKCSFGVELAVMST